MSRRHSRGDGAADSYMRAIREYSQIDTTEEARLSDIIQHGPPDERKQAIETLVCANLRLVVKIAHDFKNYGLPFQDLVSEGNIGLITAAERFDPSKGAKFSCYAAWWVKQQMRKAIAFQSQMIRVPAGSMQRMFNAYKARTRFIAENMREPTPEELQELTGYSGVTLERLSTIDAETVSMSEPVNPADGESTFEDVLCEHPHESDEPMKSRLRQAVQQCTPFEQHLISGYFGLDKAEPTPMGMLAQELGCSLQDVGDRLNKTLAKLRDLLSSDPDFTLGV